MLFTDLVGSTAWRMRVGDALADERTAELERASRQIVATAGGTVVKSVGDGVMATFTSAVAALDAASALQSAARRLTVAGTPDALRVGISSGDLVKEADDWMGAAAIEASRLCAEAAGGSVLVAAATVHLSRGRAGGRLRSVGERLLRGFEEPVEVFELLDDTRLGASLPAPLEQAADAPCLGRRQELDRLMSTLEPVATGGTATVLVVGEPGVGKTRLAAATAVAASGRGFRVLHGRCNEGLAPPYQPVVDAFGPWVTSFPEAALDRLLGPLGGELTHLWPALGVRGALPPAPPAAGDAEAQRWRLFEAVAWLVRTMAADQPLLVVVDDLQWAQPSTRLLLDHLVRQDVPGVALLATVRREHRSSGGLRRRRHREDDPRPRARPV